MSIFFTSDEHYGHENIIKYCARPYESASHMNEDLIRRHNSRVGPNDVVYHLGDFCMSRQHVPTILPRLHGHHILIAGNHDGVHPLHHKDKAERRANAFEIYRRAGFNTIALQLQYEISGHPVVLHHMPYHSDHTKDVRYKELRPTDNGLWLLHGHIHQLWRQQGRQINVGVDAWNGYPVSIEELQDLIAAGPNDLPPPPFVRVD